jgi:hypothetical protein
VSTVELDDVLLEGDTSIPLADDRKPHRIRIVLGAGTRDSRFPGEC